jgi:fatty-acyl-CoA synthase
MKQTQPSYLVEPGWIAPGRTLGSYLEETVKRFPQQMAFEDGGAPIDYQELARRSRALASGLRNLGVKSGDRVAVIEPNSTAYVYSFLATSLLGAIVVPIPADYRQRELDHILGHSQPSAIITIREWRGFDFPAGISAVYAPATTPPLIVTDEPTAAGFGTFLSLPALPESEQLPPWEADTGLLLQYTSGTTGTPKGCLHTHNSLCRPAAAMRSILPLAPTDRMIVFSNMAHLLGLIDGIFLTLMNGACLIPVARWQTEEAFELFARTQPTIVNAVPPIYLQMRNHANRANSECLRSVRACITAGTALPDPTAVWIRDVLGATIINQYGLTEISNCFDTRADEQGLIKAACVGKPTPSSEGKVVDEEGRIVPRGQPGEIYLRTPWCFAGYYNQPAKTAELVDGLGWVHSGDIGYVDDDGNLHVLSRKKDMIIRGGENIYPDEIESVLLELDYVQSAAVVGAPDERLGERTVAYIVPRSFDNVVTRQRIAQDLGHLISRHKIPDYVVTTEELPLTASGKVQRIVLRQHAARDVSGQETEVR